MSGLMNKIKEAVHPSHPETETTGRHAGAAEYGSSATGSGTNTGIHSQPAKAGEYGSSGASGVGSHGLGSSEYSSTGRTGGIGGTGGTGGTGAMYGNPASQQTAGPHSSNAANKLDPRVDSDLDNSRTMGRDQTYSSGTGTTGAHTGTHTGAHTGYGSGTTGTHTGYGTSTGGGVLGSGNTHSSGPHASNAANKLDPRVDSDRDGSSALGGGHTYGSGTTGHGALGSGTHSSTLGSGNTHNAGPHSSSAANKLDPRIDSDRDGSNTAGRHHASTGIGAGAGGAGVGAGMGSSAGNFGNPASRNTAGPHSSDAMNKMDPRVDSDLDGSKTMGRDQTFSRSHESSLAGKNPRDAAQVPPSVMMHEIGAPEPLAERREGHHNPFGHHGGHQEGSNRP